MKKKNGTVPASPGQMKDITSAVVQAIPSGLTSEKAQRIISQKGKLKKGIEALLREIAGSDEVSEMLTEWSRFYREVFSLETDFSDLVLPEKKEGFNWLIIMQEGMDANTLFEKCQERFKSWHYKDDLSDVTSDRTPHQTYAIWVRDRVEADEENKNKSANTIKKEGISGITLEERLLLELFYHWKTGKRLDIENYTLCSGSRFADGDVPYVDWDGDEMSVNRCHPDSSYDDLRSRSVVSLPKAA